MILYLWKPLFVHVIHHYYFTVKGNWRSTRAGGEKKSRYHLQISHQNFSKPSADHNAATLTVAFPKLCVHFSNVQMLDLREDPGKQWQSAVSWRMLTSLSSISCPVNANHNTEACKTPVHLLQVYLLFLSFCDCPPWQQEQPYSKRNHSELWNLQCQKGAGQ